MGQMNTAVEPKVITFLPCQIVVHDSRYQCYSPINVLLELLVEAFPCAISPLAIYAELTGPKGVSPITLVVIHACDRNDPVYSRTWLVELDGPLMVTPWRLALPVMTFPEPGDYIFQLIFNGTPISQRRLTLSLLEEETESGPSGEEPEGGDPTERP